jgi:phage terminase small subunit
MGWPQQPLRRKPAKFKHRRHLFALEYPRDLDQTAAAIRAGYSLQSASQQATILMGDPEVQEEIKDALARRADRIEVDTDFVVTQLAKVAAVSISDFMSWDKNGKVTFKASETLSPEVLAAISEFTETPHKHGSAVKVRMHDKLAALTTLGRHLGMFQDKIEVTGQVDTSAAIYQEMTVDELRDALTALRAARALEGDGSVEMISDQ